MKLIIKLDVVFVPPNLDVFVSILWLDTNIILNVTQLPTKEKLWPSNTLDSMYLY